jgi:hypothetical protein
MQLAVSTRGYVNMKKTFNFSGESLLFPYLVYKNSTKNKWCLDHIIFETLVLYSDIHNQKLGERLKIVYFKHF